MVQKGVKLFQLPAVVFVVLLLSPPIFPYFQTDRTDALLGNYNGRDSSPSPHPLHTPSGEKTRKTYDFTRTHHVGTSCHDIQAGAGEGFLLM